MREPRHPSLYQVNTRVWMTALSRTLGRDSERASSSGFGTLAGAAPVGPSPTVTASRDPARIRPRPGHRMRP